MISSSPPISVPYQLCSTSAVLQTYHQSPQEYLPVRQPPLLFDSRTGLEPSPPSEAAVGPSCHLPPLHSPRPNHLQLGRGAVSSQRLLIVPAHAVPSPDPSGLGDSTRHGAQGSRQRHSGGQRQQAELRPRGSGGLRTAKTINMISCRKPYFLPGPSPMFNNALE